MNWYQRYIKESKYADEVGKASVGATGETLKIEYTSDPSFRISYKGVNYVLDRIDSNRKIAYYIEE